MARDINETNTYADRLIKLIPTEWISAYIAIRGLVQSSSSPDNKAYYISIVLLCALLPFYLVKVLKVSNKPQILVTMVSFLVWVFSLGGEPFSTFAFYEPYQSSILLTIWTISLPIFVGRPN